MRSSVLLHSSIISKACALLIASDNYQVLKNMQNINHLPLFNVIFSVTLTSWKKWKNIDLILLQSRNDKYYNVLEPLLETFLAPLNELRLFSFAVFSPGSSCKFSNQYIIQDHMTAHYKKLMSAKGMCGLQRWRYSFSWKVKSYSKVHWLSLVLTGWRISSPFPPSPFH